MDTKGLLQKAQALIEASGQSAVATFVNMGMDAHSLFVYIALNNLNLPVNDQKAKNFTKDNVRAGKVLSMYNLFRTDANSDWGKDSKGNYLPILKAKDAGSRFAFMAENFRKQIRDHYQVTEAGKLKSKTVDGQKELVPTVKTPKQPKTPNGVDDATGEAAMNDSLTKTEVQEKVQMVVDKYRANGAFTKAVEAFSIDLCAQFDINRPE